MATKRAHAAMHPSAEAEEPVDPSDELMFLALGGGNEVGRSCHIIQYKGKTVMLDAGVHPAHSGFASLPFYDEFDLGTVDILLITHFHMDHAASLPYVLAKTNFAGRVYMTHPTKLIYKYMIQDAIRLSKTRAATASSSDGSVTELYSEQDLLTTLPQIQTISFNTTHTHNGIRITPYPAGHVLGACMYLVEIAGLSTLFTGDYSRENDRHLIPATIPQGLKVDCLITESTFGISTSIPRAERETALMKSITGILNRGGRCLLPVGAVGMTQEILLILEEYWQRHAEYQRFPIYFASALTKKCMVVYQTYIDSMNDNIRSKLHSGNERKGPWDFQFIRSLKSVEKFEDTGSCVMLAVPGMMQAGSSREMLEKWASDPKNGVVVTGYSVEGTMAKEILKEPDTIPVIMNRNFNPRDILGKRAAGAGAGDEKPTIPRRCTVQEFSFAAHVDGSENRAFIEEVDAPVVVLVHGERGNMMRMRSRLLGLGKFKVYSPANCEEVRIPFRRAKIARVVGRLANEVHPPTSAMLGGDNEGGDDSAAKKLKIESGKQDGDVLMSGVLVQNDFKLSLMSPADLREFAGLNTTTILCRQRLTLGAAGLELIKWSLEGAFGEVQIEKENGVAASGERKGEKRAKATTVLVILNGAVRLLCHPPSLAAGSGQLELELEWAGNAANDAVADAVVAVLMAIESSPAALKKTAHAHQHTTLDAFGDETETKPRQESWLSGGTHPLSARHMTAEEKLSRLFLFLEAQFGEAAIEPVSAPRLPSSTAKPTSSPASSPSSEDEVDEVTATKAELARLHAMGIPVPGLEIRVEGLPAARVWLETLEVECANRALGERVRAVVERVVEVLGGVGL